jgi:mannan endo-1,4-beta-mannosidase
MKLLKLTCVIIITTIACTHQKKSTTQSVIEPQHFVKVNGTQFELDGKPYNYVGTNFWAGMNLGATAASGNRERLLRELDKMQSIGINNLRIMALTEGPDTEPYRIVPSNNNGDVLKENYLIGLDFLLCEMKKRKMVAVVCLSNFWPWSGGFAQYQKWAGDIAKIAYPMDTTKAQDWDLYMKNTANFYSSTKAIDLYVKSISKIINRTNSISKKLYKNDETIMSWQLCNEPRGMNNVKDYLQWINKTATYIKQLDNNHLVSVGSEGFTPDKINNGTPFIETHSFKNIDYTTAHLWIQNWGWYNPQKNIETYQKAKLNAINYIREHVEIAYQMNKPFVLEEFGIMKDNGSYDANATTKKRDQYYELIFKIIYDYCKTKKAGGVNFWAWGGEGRPRESACWWKVGDDFTGDPPHELQGWYSVYNTDITTHNIIKKYTKLMNNFK